jgi:GGDEF domain-containing protein
VVGFTVFARRKSETAPQTRGGELPEALRHSLPMRFEAVGEALASGGDAVAACSVVGGDVARDGAALGEALSGLRTTYSLVRGTEPAFDATEALAVAWSEATLEYLHDLSCEDPLTGLTSLAHVRTRLAEVYREAELTDAGVQTSHALVIVALRSRGREAILEHHFTRALRLTQVAEAVRAVFSGGQTIGRLGQNRAVALVSRTPDLGTSVSTLVEYLEDLGLGGSDVRVWIEGLPASADSASRLLDELAR